MLLRKYHLLIQILWCFIGASTPFLTANAQTVLAAFEDSAEDLLTINEGSYTKALFVSNPGIYDNPDRSGINTSEKCLGAINIANADWSGNRVELKLDKPVKIAKETRMLSLLVYRSIQPKEMRIGFNDFEEAAQVYYDKVNTDSRWERVVVDLGTSHLNDSLKSIWIIFSCNWYAPRTGWAQAEYYFDDITLSGIRLPNSNIVINPTEEYQTIEDFGASDCWTADVVGKYWGTTQKEFIAEKLFSQELDSKGNPKGIGLSNWRMNLGAGTSEQGSASGLTDAVRRSECFLKSDGTYDWTKQAGQQYFMQKAKEYGCENFLFFSNTPPVYFTKNGKGFANSGESTCNLKSDKFTDFAEFMATVTEHFWDEGYHIKYISPVNEPQYDWTGGQEGSPWQNSDIKKLVTELNKSLVQRNSETKIMIPEAGSWDKLSGGSGRASNQIYNFFDSKSTNYIGNLPAVEKMAAGHSYWTFSTNATLKKVRTDLWNSAKTYSLKAAQTEWSLLDAAPTTDTGFPASYDAATHMDLALFMGKLIYCDLAFANVSSWSYWTSLATEVYSQKSRFFLLRLTPSNGNGGYDSYASLFNGGKVESTPNLWALGNYSRFIRPGYKRIRMDGASEMNHILGTAYISPNNSRIVTVYVNTSAQMQFANIAFKELNGAPAKIRKYVTSSSATLTKEATLAETYTEKVMSIPSRSIVTVVYDIQEINAIETASTEEGEKELSVYPNPVDPGKTVSASIPGANPSDDIMVTLHETGGRTIYSKTCKYHNGLSIEVPDGATSGIYLLRVVSSTASYQGKLIIK